jgi:hypothetical protein
MSADDTKGGREKVPRVAMVIDDEDRLPDEIVGGRRRERIRIHGAF